MGLILGWSAFWELEKLYASYESDVLVVEHFREATLSLLIFGNMLMLGIGIMVISFLHLIRSTARIQREVEALQKKNDEAEKLTRQLQELSHHQRLETIGRLTASISHEFNNLLTPIMGYSLMALEKIPPEDEELYDNLLEIYQSSRKAKEIISRLSDLSRKNTQNCFREVSVDELVRKTLTVANPAKPENVEIKLDLNCWDQRITANEIQLSQMLLNLILNSFHAMAEGKGILTIHSSFDETNIRLRIQDTGCGIAPDELPHIFEPFYTTKEFGKGTGLGLAIAAQMVEDHKGSIWAESEPGQGTTFFITLPR
jgi:signal transduction histidine kinase